MTSRNCLKCRIDLIKVNKISSSIILRKKYLKFSHKFIIIYIMLKHLQIKNFALIDNTEVDFSDKLNMITGETGAGKSILIQALSVLLGGRASTEQIRTGCEEAVLNGVIDIADNQVIQNLLNELGIDSEDGMLIIRRVLSSNGKSRSFMNGTQVTSKELAAVSAELFDFHGQHDGVSLLSPKTHITFLDSYAELDGELVKLKQIYGQMQDKRRDLKKLECDDEDKEKQIELMQFEIEEIETANIKDGEDESLRNEIKINENIEHLTSSLAELTEAFGGEGGILYGMKRAKSVFDSIAEFDDNLNQKSSEFDDIYYRIEDLTNELQRISGNYRYEPGLLDKLIERAEVIEKLKRKHGGSIESVRKYCEQAKKDLNLIIFSDEEKARLQKEFSALKAEYTKQAQVVSAKRCEAAKKLERAVTGELHNLGMEKAVFKIHNAFEPEVGEDSIQISGQNVRYTANGYDNIEFMISTNEGEPIKSLAKIASGGELSRVILSLKTVLTDNDNVQTMIFDEIDTGIGGKVALSIAATMKKIAARKQILCITHLAQIAAVGDANFLIHKETTEHRTSSQIQRLDGDGKVREIARMLSGNITELSLNHAKELIGGQP